ncbi:TetR/AcrR family transcriptional regulator [Actinoplanes bogorensis]|uniref:TetR/AcrR family transcriptional regulator n=1 Tax=Paractinoplanes bogorensis TaxID=1610840 RepID=A0ABS5YK15_9ACTN|nr:TetR/AcrR family transcriptional regulator [Actinoplanes bogorensis]MBU2663820.1 TetR/AcrR family transcriptional regulator [Actinoplanes bogorensis]
MARANLSPAVVVAAAAEMADRDGFEAVTLSALARHFGVQTASLYSHVRDRAALLAGVHELAMAELSDRIAMATAGRSGRDALVALAEAQRDYARQSPGRWTALQRGSAPSPASARLVSLTWAVLRGYHLSDDDLVHATRLLGATVNGWIALEGNGFAHRDPSPDVSWGRALDALDTVFHSWSST